MYLMHVAPWGDPVAKSLPFTRGQTLKANRRWCHNEDDQISMSYQRIAPAHTRAGQHPVVGAQLLLHQRNAFFRRPLCCEWRVGGRPVKIIDIDMF